MNFPSEAKVDTHDLLHIVISKLLAVKRNEMSFNAETPFYSECHLQV
jgi:hypothetical protein